MSAVRKGLAAPFLWLGVGMAWVAFGLIWLGDRIGGGR